MLELFYKDFIGSFDGELTIAVKDKQGNILEKETIRGIPCRSGARSFSEKIDIAGKTPIPVGKHYIWTQPEVIMQKNDFVAEGREIGEFFPIGTQTNRHIIPARGIYKISRFHVGLHPENAFPGSAGCIVVVGTENFKRVSALLKKYPGTWSLTVWRARK